MGFRTKITKFPLFKPLDASDLLNQLKVTKMPLD